MSDAALLDPPLIRRRKLDVRAYERMAEFGILTEADRVELIEGEIVEMSPAGAPHIGAINRLNHLFTGAAASRAVVSVHNPLHLSSGSMPEPDVALLRPRADFYGTERPMLADVLLLVEVADSSPRFDRLVKLPLYAHHGVPEVWIVDLDGEAVEVARGPGPDGYARVVRAVRGEVLEPELLPGARVRVDDVLG